MREEQRVREMMEGSGVLPASDKVQEQTIQEAFPAQIAERTPGFLLGVFPKKWSHTSNGSVTGGSGLG